MSLGRMFQWSNGLNKAPEAAFVGMTGIEGFTPTKYFLLILLHGTWSNPETSGRAKQLVVENEKSKAIDRGHGRYDKYLDQSHLFCQIMQLKITENQGWCELWKCLILRMAILAVTDRWWNDSKQRCWNSLHFRISEDSQGIYISSRWMFWSRSQSN